MVLLISKHQLYVHHAFFFFVSVFKKQVARANLIPASHVEMMIVRFPIYLIPCSLKFRACLHGVGDQGLVGLVSFVFTLWGTQNKRNLPL